jgi:hypothetical protein
MIDPAPVLLELLIKVADVDIAILGFGGGRRHHQQRDHGAQK